MWLSQYQGDDGLLNEKSMTSNHNKLLVLFYTSISDDKAIRLEIDQLTGILHSTESPDQFCTANEMVDRNRITSSRKKMLKEAKQIRLRAFRFFINKN